MPDSRLAVALADVALANAALPVSGLVLCCGEREMSGRSACQPDSFALAVVLGQSIRVRRPSAWTNAYHESKR
jgi:hypothetical protein